MVGQYKVNLLNYHRNLLKLLNYFRLLVYYPSKSKNSLALLYVDTTLLFFIADLLYLSGEVLCHSILSTKLHDPSVKSFFFQTNSLSLGYFLPHSKVVSANNLFFFSLITQKVDISKLSASIMTPFVIN